MVTFWVEGVHCDEDHLRQDEDHHHPGADHLRQGEDRLGADPLLDTVDREDPAGRHVVDRQDEQARRPGDGVVLLSGILREEGGATVRLQGAPLGVRPDRHFDHVDFLGLWWLNCFIWLMLKKWCRCILSDDIQMSYSWLLKLI